MAQLSPVLKQATPVLAARGEGVYLYDESGRSQDVPGDVLARRLEVSLPPMGAALRTYRPSGA